MGKDESDEVTEEVKKCLRIQKSTRMGLWWSSG
jgi:hypothetical protein